MADKHSLPPKEYMIDDEEDIRHLAMLGAFGAPFVVHLDPEGSCEQLRTADTMTEVETMLTRLERYHKHERTVYKRFGSDNRLWPVDEMN